MGVDQFQVARTSPLEVGCSCYFRDVVLDNVHSRDNAIQAVLKACTSINRPIGLYDHLHTLIIVSETSEYAGF